MIKEIKQEDLAECVQVIRNSFDTVAKEFNITEENAPRYTAFATDENRLNWHLNGEHRPMFGYTADGKIVGYILLSSKEGKKNGYKYRKQLEIEAMGVDVKYRNQGIGFKLLEFVKYFAKENNFTDIRLTVNEENENAIHLYEKVGFKVRNIAYTLHF